MKKLLYLVFAANLFWSCQSDQSINGFIKQENGNFIKDGNPYYFIGTNYWYGAILASTGEGGDRNRLIQELDFMKEKGIVNLRVLIGAEGPNDEPSRVTPALQLEPGVFNDTILDGLDYLLVEMGKRDMQAVLFFGNSWEWSGGYAQYLNWNGYGDIPYPILPEHTWPDFISYAAQFHSCDNCKEQLNDFIRFIIARTNRYTGLKYVDDPTIMTWEIANEPRAFSKENIPAFENWIAETAALIKSLDPNHLVTTGTEGQHGSEDSLEVFEKIHSDPNIDYLTMHIWPKNWGWLDINDIGGTIEYSIQMTNQYFDRHIDVARKLNKPIVFEEFGLPRDNHRFSLDDPTVNRDKYYENALKQVVEHAKKRDVLAGVNFWAFGGTARPHPERIFWKKGDDLMGDPPQEEQGLNAVFDTDSTIGVIAKYADLIKEVTNEKDKSQVASKE